MTYPLIPWVTLTGVDERTSLDAVEGLLHDGRVEVAVLLSAKPAGRPRYPRLKWVERFVVRFGRAVAVHVCGQTAREGAIAGAYPWLRSAGRVQVNGHISALERRILSGHGLSLIVQHREGDPLPAWGSEVQLLCDQSGGRGQLPAFWARPVYDHPVGFAGGLGPENLREQLPLIARVAREPWWVDMETGLRSEEDWFDLGRADAAAAAVLDFRSGGASS